MRELGGEHSNALLQAAKFITTVSCTIFTIICIYNQSPSSFDRFARGRENHAIHELISWTSNKWNRFCGYGKLLSFDFWSKSLVELPVNLLVMWSPDNHLFSSTTSSDQKTQILFSSLLRFFFDQFVSSPHSNCRNQSLSLRFWQKICSLCCSMLAKMTKKTKNNLWRSKKNVRGKSDWSAVIKNQSPNQIRIIIEKKKDSWARRNLDLSWDESLDIPTKNARNKVFVLRSVSIN